MASEVLVPSSAAEAVELFGDGAATTVIGGGTVVVPDITYGRLHPERVLLLSHAGLDGVSVDGDTVTLGATTPVNVLLALAEDVPALAACARNLADYEIRGQATVGGNLCMARRRARPPGLPARARRARPLRRQGRRAHGAARGLPRPPGASASCSMSRFERPAASAFVALEYPHTHEYTVLAVTAVRAADGETRLAATGLAGTGARLRSAEALASDPAAAGAAAAGRRHLRGRRPRIGLVPRADAAGARPPCPHPTRGVRMNLTVNGVETTIESGALTSLLDVLREELGITSPKAGCEQGGCGACTVLVDGEPRRSCLTPVASVDGAAITTVEGLGSPEHMAPDAAGVHAPLRGAVRLLHVGDDVGRAGLRRPRRHRRP